MTVGEKIQFYRKKIGLSQEDLGQKMLVSRQTVSLWEMDKTLPTVDNLMRLGEIFSVSIDTILGSNDPIEENTKAPNEFYTLKYEKGELDELFKKATRPLIKRIFIFTLSGIILFILLLNTFALDSAIGALIGFFLIGLISHIKGYLSYKKSWSGVESRVLQSRYRYEVFDEYFVVTVSKNDEIRKTLKMFFDEIEGVQTFGDYLVLMISGQSYIIKKSLLKADSALLSLEKSIAEKTSLKKPEDRLQLISILLFVLSICMLWGALAAVAARTAINGSMIDNMWLFFCFVPIPLASIAYSFYLKNQGYKYKKNLIVGIIMTTLLCIYGSFSMIFANI